MLDKISTTSLFQRTVHKTQLMTDKQSYAYITYILYIQNN